MGAGRQVACGVRLAGCISDWNDDKGFGFVTPNGGGDRAFVHVNAFARGSRRPISGDFISYLPARDDRGRLQAREIRHAGQKTQQPRQHSRLPRAGIGVVCVLFLAAAAVTGVVPELVAGWYVLVGLVSCVMYAVDKHAAKHDTRRTPESSLHLADLLGGWPVALIAQQQFRHKISKQSFQKVFWLTVVLNVAGLCWLLWSGKAAELSRQLVG